MEDTSAKAIDLRSAEKTLRHMFQAHQISEESYYVGLMTLASDWVQLGNLEEVTTLVLRLTPEFIKNTLPDCMKYMPGFREKAYAVARAVKVDEKALEDGQIEALLAGPVVAKA